MFRGEMCEHSNGWRPEDGVPDLAMMSDITDEGININLRTRYLRDQIYTFSGSILIAVNPYKQLDIYNNDWISRFRNQKLLQTDPHIFALAEAMYMNLVMQDYNDNSIKSINNNDNNNNNHNHNDDEFNININRTKKSSLCSLNNGSLFKNQACVISGESGAGKTETTKFILSYLCSVTPNKSTWMEHQILEANTILEAFGNAKTVRNDNSSRFGKFIQICFDSHYQINGCIIQDYLLEQSRITYQSFDERNYHVFYQLLSAGQTNQELRKKFHLMPANFYDYLNKTQCYIIDGVDDCSMFNSLRTAMSVLNMEQDSCDGLFSVLSAILWLGNLQFQQCLDNRNLNDTEQCQLTTNDQEIVKIVAELLGIEEVKLVTILLKRQINVRGSITEIPYKLHEARENRNGISKALYSRLFTWMVNFINASTNPGYNNTCFMGVLDIFGFENFDTNSFEQLCINYANEKLHKFFNHHMFAMEQELYEREGIEFCDINYTDNTPCLELLERPPNCILRFLSEECRIPKGSDSSFIEKLHLKFSTNEPHPYYIKGSDKRNWSSEFSVKHFAGSVTYNVKGFLDKNKDTQQNQLLDIIESSTNLLLRDLANCNSNNSNSNSNTTTRQAADSFRQESFDSQCSSQKTTSPQSNVINVFKVKLKSQQSFSLSSTDTSPSRNSNNQSSMQQNKLSIRRESSFTAGESSFTSLSLSSSKSINNNNNNVYTNNSSKSKPTVADAFRQQLSSLVEVLSSVNPWYVRCIKPNLEKSATDYDDKQVLLQLRYLGMSDLIRIRREGYPIHLTKHQFVCRYRCLMLKYLRTNPMSAPIKLDDDCLDSYCLRMISYLKLNQNDWKVGRTMVLLRPNAHQPLEENRNRLFVNMAILIQSVWRCYVQQKQFNRKKLASRRIQETFRAYRGRLLYLRKKRAVLTIQAYVRGMFAREIANALRGIKKVEEEEARKCLLAQQQERERQQQQQQQEMAISKLEIVITEPITNQARLSQDNPLEAADNLNKQQHLDYNIGLSSPMSQSNTSQAVSPSASWVAQEMNNSPDVRKTPSNQSIDSMNKQGIKLNNNNKDKQEMDDLIKVLERHGISLDAINNNQNGDSVYADFEKLYDVLGSQLQVNCDTQSISPSINEDDRCSFATMGTTCDGDSVSCSGQSQISSTVTEDNNCELEDRIVSIATTNSNENNTNPNVNLESRGGAGTDEETVNQDRSHHGQNQSELCETEFKSNSIESIASIISSNSLQNNENTQMAPNQTSSTNNPVQQQQQQLQEVIFVKDNARTSTFTGNCLLVTGSKLVSNGRPLTRIEEEPNSAATSPSKTPHRKRADSSSSRPQSLFPPAENDENDQSKTSAQCNEFKRRRLERKILQVQQKQLQQPINPTTAGVPISNQQQQQQPQQQQPLDGKKDNNNLASQQQYYNANANDTSTTKESSDCESIYGIQKNNIIEFAEQNFNNHLRDSLAGHGVIRTLTRRRRSVDSNSSTSEYLTKAEMLSYNSTFVIPTSHIKMHDPHNVQLSCSMFKNLCKYMTGESAKTDTETRIIQSIIRNGIEKIELRDEIYVQIIRQLTNNSNHDYCVRLWVLLGLVSAAFPASKAFSRHLIPYVQSKPRKDPSITCHAQFCLDNLQATRINARKYPPSPLEIHACKSLTNLTCKIHLLDGRCEALNIHPCDTSLDALSKLAHKINLQSIEGWALYESYTPGLSKYPHPVYEQKSEYFERSIRGHYFMADLMACWQNGSAKKNPNSTTSTSLKLAQKRIDEGGFKLTLKKRIFRGPKIRNDQVEISLLYAQAVYNVVKKDSFLVDESLALSLAGLQAQIIFGNASDLTNMNNKDNNQILKKGKSIKQAPPPPITTNISDNNKCKNPIYDIDSYICQRLRHQTNRSKKDWSILILQSHKQFHGLNEVFCKMRYLSMVIYHCPLYGTATFKVTYKGYRTLDQNLILGVNAEGLVLIGSADRALLNAYRYGDICNDIGITVFVDENIIQLNVREKSDNSVKYLSFETSENEEIALLMVSYWNQLNLNIRGSTNATNFTLDPSFDLVASRRKSKLKMTLEDRMRTHQDVQNARKAIIKSGKLRKVINDEAINQSAGLLKHTLKRLSSTNNKTKADKSTRFENVYGTILGSSNSNKSDLPQTSSDYNIYGSNNQSSSSLGSASVLGSNQLNERDSNQSPTEVAGATATTVVDELTKAFPHRYWAYTKYPLKNSLLIIYDSDLEEAALFNFNAILTYSGLISFQGANYNNNNNNDNSNNSTLDSSSIDSGIASQQSLTQINGTKVSTSNGGGGGGAGSPSNSTSSGDIYDVCPKKIDERDLLRLAQSILDRCLKKDADILKNEFFLQLIKQTTDHPEPNSEINQRHWQLLALACSVTYPSDCKILSYLYAHLRRCSLDQVTDEGQYAQFTLRSLQGTLETKGRKYAPSETEILSTINCRRVYARVYFLDGQFQAVEFDPCATIAEVVEQIKQKIGLRYDTTGYALFQPLDDDCEQVLASEEKVGDAIAAWESWHKQKQAKLNQQTFGQQQQQLLGGQNQVSKLNNKASLASLNNSTTTAKNKTHRFVFKKYLFVETMLDLNDPVERELLFHQTVASIKEDKFPVLEQEATILCALKAQIEIGDYTKLSNLPREHIKMVYKQVIMSLMPPHSFNNLPIPAIAQQHQAFRELSCIDAKKYFFNLIQTFGRANYPNNPGYILLHRAHIYDATQTFATAWPSEIWIVINQLGLHMLVAKSRRVLTSCEYRHIIDYNSNNNYLMVIVMTTTQSKLKYTFYTKQAQHIAQQMKDYMVISSVAGNKRRKSVEFNLKQQTPKQLDSRTFPNSNNTIK